MIELHLIKQNQYVFTAATNTSQDADKLDYKEGQRISDLVSRRSVLKGLGWTEEKIDGGREIERPVDLATMPLYVQAGAIVPIGPIKQFTRERVDGPLTLTIYPGADGTFTLYEDDGATFNYRKGELTKIQMSWNDGNRLLTLRLAEESRMLPPLSRRIEARLAPEKAACPVVFEGRPVQVRF